MKHLKYYRLFLIYLCLTTGYAYAQNNPIFKGGDNAGWKSVQTNRPLGGNIFTGGNGDGFGNGISVRPAIDLFFTGGSGDGWNNLKSARPRVDSLFTGGTGDGWNNLQSARPLVDSLFAGGNGDGWYTATSVRPIVDTIFSGGNGDGWSDKKSAISSVDSLFKGGRGDGWASNYINLTPLPVQLLFFTGEQRNGQHILTWKTSLEINSDHFSVERKAGNSNTFNSIGIVAAAGNSAVPKQYSLVDVTPVTGNNFYRLLLSDKDGRSTYSNIVLLRLLKDKSILSVFPNPTATSIHIQLAGAIDGSNVKLELFDAAGKLVSNSNLKKDNTTLSVDVSRFAKGIYTLRITENGETTAVSFVKQ